MHYSTQVANRLYQIRELNSWRLESTELPRVVNSEAVYRQDALSRNMVCGEGVYTVCGCTPTDRGQAPPIRPNNSATFVRTLNMSRSVMQWLSDFVFAEDPSSSPLRTRAHIRVLGTPTEETWPGVETYVQLKQSFPKWPRRSVEEMFPSLDYHCRGLLVSLLAHHPAARISAKAACKHPYIQGTNPTKAGADAHGRGKGERL